MVSLEERSAYIAQLRGEGIPGFFIDLLESKQVVPPALIQSDTRSLACNIFAFVRSNDMARCSELYGVLARRKPSKETEWIYNDYFIFSILCAVKKFNLPFGWLKEILSLRGSVVDEEKRYINDSFKNILAGNVNIRGDYHQISLVYQFITEAEEYDEGRINKMFRHLWRSSFPFFNSTFLNIVSLKAIEIAFESKSMGNPDKLYSTDKFIKQFLAKTATVANTTAYIMYYTVIGLLIVAALYYPEEKYIKMILSVLALFGVGISNYSDLRKKFAQHLTVKLRTVLGYSSKE